MKILLTEKNSNITTEYTEPIYTKLNSVYGYLTVSKFSVHFIWTIGDDFGCDDVSEDYIVEYKIEG